MDSPKKFKRPRKIGMSWQRHTCYIAFLCVVVVGPMVAFIIATAWIVSVNRLNPNSCPNEQLCPPSTIRNQSDKSYIYVDYPAAQLVFVSSLSATISFALVGVLMSIYAYYTASKLLKQSSNEKDVRSLPNPFQTSLLLRLLNAEMMSLCETVLSNIKAVFFDRQPSPERKPSYLSASTTNSALNILSLCLFASLFIQASDIYLHVTTKAVNMEKIYTTRPETQNYGFRLSPECLNNTSVGTYGSQYFWGCGMVNTPGLTNNTRSLRLRNRGAYIDSRGEPVYNSALSHRLDDGSHIAIVGPNSKKPGFDWKASTYGVSSRCAAIPRSACAQVNPKNRTETDRGINRYNCFKDRGFMDVEVIMRTDVHQLFYLNNHALMNDSVFFPGQGDPDYRSIHRAAWYHAANSTVEDTELYFRNPWRSFHTFYVADNEESHMEEKDERYWTLARSSVSLFLDCNVTVWDIEYTAFAGNVTSVNLTKSNGSLAGLVSVPTMGSLEFLGDEYNPGMRAAAAVQGRSVDQMVEIFALWKSKVLTMPLAANTVPKPAIIVQERIPKVISRLPKLALGISIAANTVFLLLGTVLGLLALFVSTKDVYQVHARLGIPGLVAQLCETENSKVAAKNNSDLFDNTKKDSQSMESMKKRVGVKKTQQGGSIFVVAEVS